ncbi:hypothetical protein SMICM304S_03243 [Streptomyces microflavus]
MGETGWPYIQFKGGPQGFVHVLDPYTLAFLDVRGNRQYVTTGNVRGDDRVALFFIDHARQTRLKLYGHASAVLVDENLELAERLESPRTRGQGRTDRHHPGRGLRLELPQPHHPPLQPARGLRGPGPGP